MAFESLGANALDYFPCRYGKSKLQFRGPRRRTEGDYVAVLGGTETYGKFVVHPYPALIEAETARTVVNFGLPNAGIDVFMHDETVLNACSRATLTVLQITGAQNMSNRFYAVHPRRNDRFLRASTLLKTIYAGVDFTEFNFTRHLLTSLRRRSASKFTMVEAELKEAWVGRMKTLISRIQSPVVLLWLADHSPDNAETCTIEGSDPLFVDRAMLNAVRPYAHGLVEVVASLDEVAAGFDGLVFNEMEEPAAREVLGTVAHERTAEALEPVLAQFA